MPEKMALARAAAGLIQPGQVVFLDGGMSGGVPESKVVGSLKRQTSQLQWVPYSTRN